jgi:hypothetical protein
MEIDILDIDLAAIPEANVDPIANALVDDREDVCGHHRSARAARKSIPSANAVHRDICFKPNFGACFDISLGSE